MYSSMLLNNDIHDSLYKLYIRYDGFIWNGETYLLGVQVLRASVFIQEIYFFL